MGGARQVLRALALCTVVCLAGCEPAAAPPRLPRFVVPRTAPPPVSFVDAAGGTVTLDRFAGRVVVLNLWASWCPPCLAEMPSLERLARQHPELAVVAVNVDTAGGSAEAWLARLGVSALEPYHDREGRLLRSLGMRGLPTTLVIDREGRVAASVEGAVDWASSDVLRVIGSVATP